MIEYETHLYIFENTSKGNLAKGLINQIFKILFQNS